MGSALSSIMGGQSNFQAGAGQDFASGVNNAQTTVNSNIANQNSLAATLQQQANGAGPNPAQNMLNQATNNNISQSTAMMASQKGINAGSTQRQAALNAANTNQQAAGQAATMESQQQLAAQGQLANVYNSVGSEAQNNQNSYQSASTAADSTNAKTALANASAASSMAGGLVSGVATGGLSSALSSVGNAAMAHGGTVPGTANVPGDSKKNDIVPTMLSPGEIVIPRSHANDSKNAKAFIDHIMSDKKGAQEPKGYGEIAQLKARIQQLEKKVKAKA